MNHSNSISRRLQAPYPSRDRVEQVGAALGADADAPSADGALRFAREGATVIAAARTTGEVEAVAREVEAHGGRALAVTRAQPGPLWPPAKGCQLSQ